jgi:hypothetical protein
MWKHATPALFGLSFLALGATGALAQSLPYVAPGPVTSVGSAPYSPSYPQSALQVCVNRTFSSGYGSPEYNIVCPPEGTWVAPWAWQDPYSGYRPYSDGLGPKPST